MRPARPIDRPRPRQTVALVAVSLALLLQCLAPPGYMAGSLDDGWPVVLCPEGLPAGFLGQHAHLQDRFSLIRPEPHRLTPDLIKH